MDKSYSHPVFQVKQSASVFAVAAKAHVLVAHLLGIEKSQAQGIPLVSYIKAQADYLSAALDKPPGGE